MPYGHRIPWSVKREFFDLVCRGMATTEASVKVGVSRRTGWFWWRDGQLGRAFHHVSLNQGSQHL